MKIILLGYMASGKSSIGKKLSKLLSMRFLDLDDYIIEKEKMPISSIFEKKGEVYFYRGGLLKTNFESKEYNRIFDEIYLISSLVSEDHSQHETASAASGSTAKKEIVVKEDIPTHTEKTVVHKGTIKISELVSDPKKYEGHTVQLSGKCVKVNPNGLQEIIFSSIPSFLRVF